MTNQDLTISVYVLLAVVGGLLWVAIREHYLRNHYHDKYHELEAEHTQLALDHMNLQRDYGSLLTRKIIAAIKVRGTVKMDTSKAERN